MFGKKNKIECMICGADIENKKKCPYSIFESERAYRHLFFT